MKKICFFVVCFLVIIPILSAKEYELNVSKDKDVKKQVTTVQDKEEEK